MQNIVVQKSELKVICAITLHHVFIGPGLVASKMDVAEESMGVEAFTRARFYRHIIKNSCNTWKSDNRTPVGRPLLKAPPPAKQC